jgi:hypothetical protein
MKPELISVIAAAISALAALVTIYMYRAQGKGFIWTRDPGVQLSFLPDKSMQIVVLIPLYNLGSGNLRFPSLKAKRIHLKNNAIESFRMDMDEAYFPPGVSIITYRTPVFSNLQGVDAAKSPLVQVIDAKSLAEVNAGEIQEAINKNLAELGEVLFLLECRYKDGSWLGFGTRTTRIAMSLSKLDLNYLSVARRRELDELFR